MNQRIQRLVVGETPTLIEAEKGNELIDRINAMGAISIEQGTKDEVIYSGDSIKIRYKFPPNGWEFKEITLCEEGEEVTNTFLVRSSV